MATTQDIRRRIRSVKNTMQVTRAMKMVSAAKLRRAQQNMQRARPYSERLLNLLKSVAMRVDADANPLLQQHETNHRVGLVEIFRDGSRYRWAEEARGTSRSRYWIEVLERNNRPGR